MNTLFGQARKIDGPISHFKGFEREGLLKHSPGVGSYSPEKQSIYSKLGGVISPPPRDPTKPKKLNFLNHNE